MASPQSSPSKPSMKRVRNVADHVLLQPDLKSQAANLVPGAFVGRCLKCSPAEAGESDLLGEGRQNIKVLSVKDATKTTFGKFFVQCPDSDSHDTWRYADILHR